MDLRISRGLKASYKNLVSYSIPDALNLIKQRTDNYEVLNSINRPYGDIDGVIDVQELEFNEINEKTKQAIIDTLQDEEYSLMTASSFLHKKISWRFVLTKYSMEKKDNKKWVEELEFNFPDGVKIDNGVYGENRKMRMLGSNKDGENRPLILIKGEPIDTLISYLPGNITPLKYSKKVEKQKVKENKTKVKREETLISKILQGLNRSDYKNWLDIGMICFNENEDLCTWDEYSRKFDNFETGVCEQKWKTFKKGSLTIATLWKMLIDDNLDHYNTLKEFDYGFMKQEFEQTHFKLMNPPLFVREYNGELIFLKKADLIHCYTNKKCYGKLFVNLWCEDENIRTFENLVYLPKRAVPVGSYNLFSGFNIESIQGDISAPQSVLKLISKQNAEVFSYIEKWVAHLIQKPYEKPGTCIIIQGNQGIGKDTYFDFIGKMLSDYFFNTSRADTEVFTRFNGHLKKTLLMKFEEASYSTNKNFDSSLKSLITSTQMNFEDKGAGIVKLDNYLRIVMTTNAEVPVPIEQTDRRFFLVQGSDERMGDLEFWKYTHKELAKQETLQAYYYYLLNLDISDFNPKERPITEFYRETKNRFIPYHAEFFQRTIEDSSADELSWRAKDLLEAIKNELKLKYEITQTKVGLDLKHHYPNIISKKETNKGYVYSVNLKVLRTHLEQKHWWSEF
jgi:hypothetical protein